MSLRIVLLDDEELALKNLTFAVSKAVPDAELFCTDSPFEAISHIQANDADVVMADIEMPGMNGITFAKRVKEIRPDINLIFVTAYSEYALEAFGERASGYLMKPVKSSDIEKELENLRYPIAPPKKDLLRAVCFGRFEVYWKEEPITFRRQGEKEVLAYLIGLHGRGANTSELCEVLWEDTVERSKRRDYFRVLYHGLKKTLERVGCDDILIKKQNYFAVDPSKISCDYYDFLSGDVQAINSYHGEYMSQYPWAEMKLDTLDEAMKKKN